MSIDLKQLWQAVLGELELSISSAEYKTWFANTYIISRENEKFIIGVSNNFARERLLKKYAEDIKKVLEKISKVNEVKLSFEISSFPPLNVSLPSIKSSRQTDLTPKKEKKKSSTISFDLAQTNLNPRYTFDSFIVGSGNRLAHAASQAVADNPGFSYNPLFIYSGVGLGKTHLLHAIGLEVLKKFPEKKVFYLPAEQFTNELISGIRNQTTLEFRKKFRKNDVLLIDDIQFIAGKESTQEEFFHTFNALRESNRQLIISSDRPPKEILTLEERLRSRFESGLLTDIAPPDYETRLAILNYKTEALGLEMPKEVLEYIARVVTNNIRELEGAINSIVAKSQLEEVAVTYEMAQEVLGKTMGVRKKIKNENVFKAVLEFYDVTLSELKGKRRDKKVSFPRQILMYFLRKECQLSFEAIGEMIGSRDHTTVMHACEKIEKSQLNDDRVENEINLIREKIFMKK